MTYPGIDSDHQVDTVAAVHPDYQAMCPAWDTADDVAFGGARAVKAAGRLYLPPLAWVEDAAAKYKAYVLRAVFSNAVLRTRVAIEGQVFRTPPQVVIPSSVLSTDDAEDLLARFAHDGASFEVFARRVFSQVFGMSRAVAVIDVTPAGEPVATLYGAKAMPNWWTAPVEGRVQGVRTIFAEITYEATGSYTRRAVPVRREYLWVLGDPPVEYTRPPSATGYLTVVEHRYVAGAWRMGAPSIPSRRGVTLSTFPVTVINPYDLGYATTEPVLSEMMDVNLSLYRTSADLEHGRHFAGVPAPYVFGVKKGTAIELGSSTFLTSENPAAKAGFIEFTAQGLRALEVAVTEKTLQLVEAGARLFAPQSGGHSTYEAGRLESAADRSIVESVARTVSHGLTLVLAQAIAARAPQAASVEEIRSEITVRLNTDYEPLPLTATDAIRWTEAFLKDGISRETMWEVFQRGGVYPPGWSMAEEHASIAAARVARAAMAPDTMPPGTGSQFGRAPRRTPQGDRRVQGTRDASGESQGSPSRSDGPPA